MTCDDTVHGVCRGKTWREFLRAVIHNKIPQLAPTCLWKKGAAQLPMRSFLVCPNEASRLRERPARPLGGGAPECLRPVGRLGYHSRVCSIMGDAVDRIAEAIDQLASDARGEAGGQELAARVAELWLMLSALDPELARRKQHYSTPAGGAPSP